MIDTVNLRLIEYAEKLFVKRARGILIVAERFFDDDTGPRFIGLGTREAGFPKLLDNLQVDFRRSGEIKKAIATELGFGVELVQPLRKTAESFRVIIVSGKILKIFQEFTPPIIVGLGRLGFRQSFSRLAPKFGIVHFCARKPNQAESRRETSMESKVIERGQKFSLGQVAGRTEHDDSARLRRDLAVIRVGFRFLGSF